ncbi:hypothetical protein [Calothrix sp. 336/3]|uniref:hypothetical protein n=1 Tax=Calothrix sp. 336/3 TaxID=1337936 RepID=UPI0004E410E3|nr:hypothetical protein [Calothrix sp. 336/3]AKG20301.1 hypothetical protein IJ00_02310 [Calothrix sp. 336/3]
MDKKTGTILLLILALVFIGFGDSFLPKPLSVASRNTRNTINQLIVGFFPSWQPKVKPQERTNKAIEETEK